MPNGLNGGRPHAIINLKFRKSIINEALGNFFETPQPSGKHPICSIYKNQGILSAKKNDENT